MINYNRGTAPRTAGNTVNVTKKPKNIIKFKSGMKDISDLNVWKGVLSTFTETSLFSTF